MLQVVAGIYIFVGIAGLAGSFIIAMQTQMWLWALYAAAASVGTLAFGLVMNTLGELSETTRQVLTVLLSDPDDKPIQCPRCSALLTGHDRVGECPRCSAKLPNPRRSAEQNQTDEAPN
jgi:uncharacterized paraquat-inducible protein A